MADRTKYEYIAEELMSNVHSNEPYPGLTTKPSGDDPETSRIHLVALDLESKGMIRRHYISAKGDITWLPVGATARQIRTAVKRAMAQEERLTDE